MRSYLPLLALLAGCGPSPDPEETPPIDLTAPLGPDEVRAGVITDPAALIGGISAEGRLGDVLLVNDRVRFVVQGVRDDGAFYVRTGGNVIDADQVRAPGDPGRDIIDEMAFMAGLGRNIAPETVEVIEDGLDGGAAHVRVTGRASEMAILTGVAESMALVPQREATIVQDLILEPGSWLLDIETTVTWEDDPMTVDLADLIMPTSDAAQPFRPAAGFDDGAERDPTWVGSVGTRNEVAMALFPAEDAFVENSLASLLEGLGSVLVGFGPHVVLEDGDTATFRRLLGVGPDLATLTAAWHARRGETLTTVSGRVEADGAPVAGARVHLLDADGSPVTVAFADADGRWSADVTDRVTSAVATGRGPLERVDLPPGTAWYPPYGDTAQREQALRSLTEGAAAPPFAEGYGISEPVAVGPDLMTLALAAPGRLRVVVDDGRPAVAVLIRTDGSPSNGDTRLLPWRSASQVAELYLLDGDMEVAVEPGAYDVLVHRGLGWEPDRVPVTVSAGATARADAHLEAAWDLDGVLTLDPHAHSTPSMDASIPMEHRLATHAGNGVDVHFGTDHDHIVDYRPLVEAMGLSDAMTSIVADEVSPTLRGHMNAYPLREVPDAPNHGAVLWWETWVDWESTEDLVASIRTMFEGADGIVQTNHPRDDGVFAAASLQSGSGVIGEPDHWSDHLDAMEVINDGSYDQPFLDYLSLVSRGYLITPVAVSDSHGYRSGAGENLTFLHTGGVLEDFSPDLLVASMRRHGTVASHGPFIDARIDGAWAPGTTVEGTATLDVSLQAPSFVLIDTVELYRNTTLVEQAAPPGDGASLHFALDADEDAAWVVVARGSQTMAPVYPGSRPWAMTAAVLQDVDGDGWTPPLPPLQR